MAHSAYSHSAAVELTGNRLRVISWGAKTFVDVIDARDGRQVGRKTFAR